MPYKMIGALGVAAFMAVLIMGDRGLQFVQVIVLPALTGIIGLGFPAERADPKLPRARIERNANYDANPE